MNLAQVSHVHTSSTIRRRRPIRIIRLILSNPNLRHVNHSNSLNPTPKRLTNSLRPDNSASVTNRIQRQRTPLTTPLLTKHQRRRQVRRNRTTVIHTHLKIHHSIRTRRTRTRTRLVNYRTRTPKQSTRHHRRINHRLSSINVNQISFRTSNQRNKIEHSRSKRSAPLQTTQRKRHTKGTTRFQ